MVGMAWMVRYTAALVLGALLACSKPDKPAVSATAAERGAGERPRPERPEPPAPPPAPLGWATARADPQSELPPDPELISAPALAEFLPDELFGFEAQGPAMPHVEQNAEAGTQAPSATRNYVRDGHTLRIHVVDATYIPYMRGTIAETMGTFRQTPELAVIGREVQGQPASVQWRGNAARVGLLVDDQVVISITVTPAAGHEEGLEVAQRLDIAPLRRLIAARAKGRSGQDNAATEREGLVRSGPALAPEAAPQAAKSRQ